jgi:hypothetical protein
MVSWEPPRRRCPQAAHDRAWITAGPSHQPPSSVSRARPRPACPAPAPPGPGHHPRDLLWRKGRTSTHGRVRLIFPHRPLPGPPPPAPTRSRGPAPTRARRPHRAPQRRDMRPGPPVAAGARLRFAAHGPRKRARNAARTRCERGGSGAPVTGGAGGAPAPGGVPAGAGGALVAGPRRPPQPPQGPAPWRAQAVLHRFTSGSPGTADPRWAAGQRPPAGRAAPPPGPWRAGCAPHERACDPRHFQAALAWPWPRCHDFRTPSLPENKPGRAMG